MIQTLVADISSHGYGHAGQLIPVLNEFSARCPTWRIVVRTQLPQHFLAQRLNFAFDYVPTVYDFGMAMASALDVLPEESLKRYKVFHDEWDRHLAEAVSALDDISPDLLISNIAYLPLVAADKLKIPAFALCSLNWADIFGAFCGHLPGAVAIQQTMLSCYQMARCFFQPAPSMPMDHLSNRFAVGPVARYGTNRRQEILAQLQLADDPGARLILFSMGGMSYSLDFSRWPRWPSNLRILAPSGHEARHPNVVGLEALGISFIDLLTSCDALVTKPGYGLIVDAACNGIPMIYVPRGDWPEEPYLIPWAHQHNRAAAISRDALLQGDWEHVLNTLWLQSVPPNVEPTGAVDVVERMLSELVSI